MKSLGAERVLDYTKEEGPPSGERYEVIFDAVGKAKSSPFKVQCQAALTPQGKYLSVDEGRPQVRTEGLLFLKERMEAGQIKAVIDRCYPLEQMVEAHRYVDQGHKKGNVVIMVAHHSQS